MDKFERRYFPAPDVEVRVEGEEDSQKIEGMGIVYNRRTEIMPDFVEIIRTGAARRAIENGDVRSLFNHDPNYVLGRQASQTLELEDKPSGVWYSADPPDTQWARDLQVSIRRGDITGSSFSFIVARDGEILREEGNKLIREITDIEWMGDIGPVTFPAYRQTTTQVRSLAYRSNIDIDQINHALIRVNMGFELRNQDRKVLEELWSILKHEATEEVSASVELLERQLELTAREV